MLEHDYLATDNVEYGSTEMIDEVNRLFNKINPLSNSKFVMTGHEDGVMVFCCDLLSAELTLYKILGKNDL